MIVWCADLVISVVAWSSRSIGDWDGDGIKEFCVFGEGEADSRGVRNKSSVVVRSGRTGADLSSVCLKVPLSPELGPRCELVADLDGDHDQDLLISHSFIATPCDLGALKASLYSTVLQVVSSKSGEVLSCLVGPVSSDPVIPIGYDLRYIVDSIGTKGTVVCMSRGRDLVLWRPQRDRVDAIEDLSALVQLGTDGAFGFVPGTTRRGVSLIAVVAGGSKDPRMHLSRSDLEGSVLERVSIQEALPDRGGFDVLIAGTVDSVGSNDDEIFIAVCRNAVDKLIVQIFRVEFGSGRLVALGDELESSLAYKHLDRTTDVDGDGVDDLVFVDEFWEDDQLEEVGRILVLSSRDGRVLARLDGRWTGQLFGVSALGVSEDQGLGRTIHFLRACELGQRCLLQLWIAR